MEWKAGCPTYARIVYEELWPGIDLVYQGTVNQLKYEFVVKPGVDPGNIRLRYRGATNVSRTAAGHVSCRSRRWRPSSRAGAAAASVATIVRA